MFPPRSESSDKGCGRYRMTGAGRWINPAEKAAVRLESLGWNRKSEKRPTGSHTFCNDHKVERVVLSVTPCHNK